MIFIPSVFLYISTKYAIFPFFLFPVPQKSAKPALCTPRIAKAILVDAPLLYGHFPIP
jgi:hypothetical protein